MNTTMKNPCRRRFLRGLGALVALPTLESVDVQVLRAASPILGTTKSGAPLRMAPVRMLAPALAF